MTIDTPMPLTLRAGAQSHDEPRATSAPVRIRCRTNSFLVIAVRLIPGAPEATRRPPGIARTSNPRPTPSTRSSEEPRVREVATHPPAPTASRQASPPRCIPQRPHCIAHTILSVRRNSRWGHPQLVSPLSCRCGIELRRGLALAPAGRTLPLGRPALCTSGDARHPGRRSGGNSRRDTRNAGWSQLAMNAGHAQREKRTGKKSEYVRTALAVARIAGRAARLRVTSSPARPTRRRDDAPPRLRIVRERD